jgi:hypothetical protein
MENKVIYLNEETKENEEYSNKNLSKDNKSQFTDNTQFSDVGETNYSGGGKEDNHEYNDGNNGNNRGGDSEEHEGGDSEEQERGDDDVQEGGDDDMHSVSSMESGISSVNTNQILELDPMYIRLTKFLQTGGDNKKNMADILLDISNNFTKLNENLENLSNKMTKMALQQ